MNAELYTAAQGMVARQIQLDQISHNLACINNTGFREVQSFFRVFNQALEDGPQNPVNGAANNQPVLAGTYVVAREGSLKATGGEFDFAIQGDGFFRLQTPFGLRYTRNGAFQLDDQGVLTSRQGYAVLDDRGQPVRLQGAVEQVDAQGQIWSQGSVAARLGLVSLTDPGALVPEEDGLLTSLAANQAELPARGRVQHGYLESSNVDLAQQMVRMIEAHRSYEMNTRLIRTIDREMNQAVIQQMGRR